MKTTLTLDDDVVRLLEEEAKERAMSSSAIRVVVVALLITPGYVRAGDGESESRRLGRRSSVQADAGLVLSPPSRSGGLSAGSLGVSAGHIITQRFSVEASLRIIARKDIRARPHGRPCILWR
jgi:hypothetical protein